jgi:hypothetical protein
MECGYTRQEIPLLSALTLAIVVRERMNACSHHHRLLPALAMEIESKGRISTWQVALIIMLEGMRALLVLIKRRVRYGSQQRQVIYIAGEGVQEIKQSEKMIEEEE